MKYSLDTIATDFELLDSQKNPRKLSDLLQQNKVIFIVYRGWW